LIHHPVEISNGGADISESLHTLFVPLLSVHIE
jgi:hypothetical protein